MTLSGGPCVPKLCPQRVEIVAAFDFAAYRLPVGLRLSYSPRDGRADDEGGHGMTEGMQPTIIVGQEQPPVLEQESKQPRRSAPKWETTARERVRAGVRRFSKSLADLVNRDANEGDTRLLVTDFLCDVLGYDKYEDLTTEYQVKGEFADYGVRIDKEMVAFIEVKRVTTKLAPKHLRQVEMYAVNEGVEWVILTNGAVWQAYHLDVSRGLPVVMDLALEVHLLGEESPAQKAGQLFYLTRDSFKRGRIEELWRQKVATSPRALASVVTAPVVVEAIRKELRRKTTQRLDSGEVIRLLKETVIRPEALS